MTDQQRLALDAVEAYCTAIKRLRELQRRADITPAPIAHILFAFYAVPDDFLNLGDAYKLDFRRQIRALKSDLCTTWSP
jgi:hypothetical protein